MMATTTPTLILASGSPRRHEILTTAAIPHIVRPACADESLPTGIRPDAAVESLSARKAEAAMATAAPQEIILAADTVVALRGRILGKPRDEADAADMLRALSGTTHEVYTGITLRSAKTAITAHERTVVHMRPLSEEEIFAYIRTSEPMDKAGAYGIQGLAGAFVERIEGDYFNIVGLPLCLCARLLGEHFSFYPAYRQ